MRANETLQGVGSPPLPPGSILDDQAPANNPGKKRSTRTKSERGPKSGAQRVSECRKRQREKCSTNKKKKKKSRGKIEGQGTNKGSTNDQILEVQGQVNVQGQGNNDVSNPHDGDKQVYPQYCHNCMRQNFDGVHSFLKMNFHYVSSHNI